MILKELFKNSKVLKTIGSMEKEITNLSQDSRDDSFSHTVYFALRGTQTDGHIFIPQVIEKKASAIVCEELPDILNDSVTYILVENSRSAVGIIASEFYNNPSRELTVIAVTGTNGKTSVVNYATQVLQKLEQKTLLLSTAGDFFNGKKITIHRKASSSLEIIEFHKILRTYVDCGARYVCLEATSHALDQERLSGIDIDVAIFTNLTRDHIDYHKTIESYADAKSLLFKNLKKTGTAIINSDDAFSEKMISKAQSKKISYGKKNTADYFFDIEKISQNGTSVSINNQQMLIPVVGEFNIYNISAVYTLLIELGYTHHQIQPLLENIMGVPGRMELVNNNKESLVIVDYAHTPDALENVLRTLSEIPHNTITTIIGCGGDRDRTKRAPMSMITQLGSDKAIYTADNPRTEDLKQIFDDMKKGIDIHKNNYLFIPSREEAIKEGIKGLSKQDILLIAGKGHEDYQIIGTEKIHFDDKEVALKYLNNN